MPPFKKSMKKVLTKAMNKSLIKESPEYNEIVRKSAYLGKKGYTIPKSALSETDLECVKKDLIMTPFTMGPKVKGVDDSFPIYRDNVAKVYLPRFYGIKRYGLPDKSELSLGTDIDVPFVKELRDYQKKIIKVYIDYVGSGSPIVDLHDASSGDTAMGEPKVGARGGGGAILEVPCGKGKCLAKGTAIMMFDRSVKNVEDIVVGDLLMGDDMRSRRVLSLARGREKMYKISQKGSGWFYVINESHILSLKDKKSGEVFDIPLLDYLELNNPDVLQGYRIPNDFMDLTYDIFVTPLFEDDYYGFEIDGNRRFVLGEGTVTHNTVMALNIISQLKKKTLILVHKEFLMNQWIERIAEFMPSAKVGKIQGPLFEVEGRDIVIGMIQTMYSREFTSDSFDSFGLTVIDEVHRIGSEEFSKTLFKVVTPYMLGISATVERKDRLTKILYMFIGDKIYSEERTDDDIVQVRAVMFKSRDPEFNEVEYDFRGSPKYSTMISKLCAFGPRSDFIVRIIGDLIKENPHKQIMVLAHNRDLLTFLYDAIRHRISDEENTVGYYVGGMKEKDLKITEGRRIVLATYAMAAEALDIKTLSTLVMATPKTDIEQSVGRILRAKGQNPIVVDILDAHDYLKRQWNSRRLFYKKCNYRITSTDIDGYTGFENMDRWRVEFDPAVATASAKEKKKCMINIPKEVLEAEVV
jgi:hypothetical protein